MRLHGVVKSTSLLSSRLGVCESARGWIIEEFTAQMCAVSKIALHRRSNLAGFLEINGMISKLRHNTLAVCSYSHFNSYPKKLKLCFYLIVDI